MHNALLQSFGLDFLDEDENLLHTFISNALQKGYISKTYYGSKHLNYYYGFLRKDGSVIGDPLQIICNLEESSEGRLDLGSFDVHNTGSNVWKFKVLTECNDEIKRYTGQRQIVCNSINDQDGLIVVNVMNPDILPSYLPGDEIKLQMKAIAIDINFYKNDEEYMNSYKNEFKLGEGVVSSTQYIYNHQLGFDGKPLNRDIDYEANDYTLVRGKVKSFHIYAIANDDGKEMCRFINTIVETKYGDLEIVHSFSHIKNEQFIAEGSEVLALCVLQGDALLVDKDIILNRENNIRALNFALNSGETNRISNILTDDVYYYSESTNIVKKGKKDIIDYFDYVYKNQHNVKKYITLDEDTKEEVINIDYNDLSPQKIKIICNENSLISKILVQERNLKGEKDGRII